MEVQQAYSNSLSGIDKMSLERQMQDRGRKMVKERSATGEERHTDLFRGMEEQQAREFDQQWQRDAAPYLPPHCSGIPQMAIGGRSSSQQQQLTQGYPVSGSRSMQPTVQAALPMPQRTLMWS